MNFKRFSLRIPAMLALFMLAGTFSQPFNVRAGELDKLRVQAGLKLFPAVIAADMDIRTKTDETDRLLLLVVYRDNKIIADEMAASLLKVKAIRGIDINVDTASFEEIDCDYPKRAAGLFVTQSSEDGLKEIVSFGQSRQLIVFSPFQGDVEKGAVCGLLISDVIEPYVNARALNNSSIRLKSFFLKVATIYE